MEHRGAVDRMLHALIDQDLSVVFCDLTTIRAEGDSMQEGDVRRFGMAKEGVIARQFLLGVVQTAEGVPIYHEVFDGNVAETRTLLPTLGTVLERFPSVRRLILVADRGLLSLDNLESLRKIRLAPTAAPWSSSLRCRGGATTSSWKPSRRSTRTRARAPRRKWSPSRPGRICAWSLRTIP